MSEKKTDDDNSQSTASPTSITTSYDNPNTVAGIGIPAEISSAGEPALETTGAGADTGSDTTAPESASASPPIDTISQIKQFSEELQMEKVQVPAAFPFDFHIEGELLPEEKEKLLDILSREGMGVRQVDLEPQLASNSILIPRISEYAGVLLVQALRTTRAKIRFTPTIDTDLDLYGSRPSVEPPRAAFVDEASHPAERVAITQDKSLPQIPLFSVIDVVTASAALTASTVEAESSKEYQNVLENLQRELKYKAYRKGAVALLCFKIQLEPLSLPSQYRLILSATAIKPDSVNGISELDSPPKPSA